METKTALVRADCRVELYPVTAVYLHLACVIDPCHTEADETLGVSHTAEDIVRLNFGALLDNLFKGAENLLNRLNKLRLLAVTCFDACDYICNVFIQNSFDLSCKNMEKLYYFNALKSIVLQVKISELANLLQSVLKIPFACVIIV